MGKQRVGEEIKGDFGRIERVKREIEGETRGIKKRLSEGEIRGKRMPSGISSPAKRL